MSITPFSAIPHLGGSSGRQIQRVMVEPWEIRPAPKTAARSSQVATVQGRYRHSVNGRRYKL
ncbi:hypothetical protein MW887_006020 [Aspergillus wentii]|nr:hypothetical protein MW887_006020 [Aspergillus wentii]